MFCHTSKLLRRVGFLRKHLVLGDNGRVTQAWKSESGITQGAQFERLKSSQSGNGSKTISELVKAVPVPHNEDNIENVGEELTGAIKRGETAA